MKILGFYILDLEFLWTTHMPRGGFFILLNVRRIHLYEKKNV